MDQYTEIMRKQLTSSDISLRKLLVPSGSVTYFRSKLGGRDSWDFVVKDSAKKDWSFSFYTGSRLQRLAGIQPQPVLTKDWARFAEQRLVAAGDEIVISEYRDRDDGMLKLRISVHKNNYQFK